MGRLISTAAFVTIVCVFAFAKVGVAIKSGENFTITVPQEWQDRMRIGWGNHGEVLATTLRVHGCASKTPGAVCLVYPVGSG